jgi:ABC-2 type transport system ATP-binding protein
VVNAVDLSIPHGVTAGFVGPNAAGKTTTLRMLLGLVRPSAGGGCVLGCPLTRPHDYLDRVGAMIEGPAFYPVLSGRDNLRVLARLGGIAETRVGEALALVGLGSRAEDRFRTYSLGMKQRLGIAAALLPSPDLLILDEPTNGLDPAGIVEMRGLLRSLAGEGRTILVSSHLLSEIEQICDYLIVIREGRLVFQGSLPELAASQAPELVLRPSEPGDIARLAQVLTGWGHRVTVDETHQGDALVRVNAGAELAAGLNYALLREGIVLAELRPVRQSLEDSFFALTGAQPAETRAASPSLHPGW